MLWARSKIMAHEYHPSQTTSTHLSAGYMKVVIIKKSVYIKIIVAEKESLNIIFQCPISKNTGLMRQLKLCCLLVSEHILPPKKICNIDKHPINLQRDTASNATLISPETWKTHNSPEDTTGTQCFDRKLDIIREVSCTHSKVNVTTSTTVYFTKNSELDLSRLGL